MAKRGPKPIEYDHAEVARLYMAGGRQPASHVAEQLGVTRDVARKRISQVRAEGLLPPTEKGRMTLAEHHPARAEVGRGTKNRREWTVCFNCLTAWPCEEQQRAGRFQAGLSPC